MTAAPITGLDLQTLRVLLVQPIGFGHDRARTTLALEADMAVIGECSNAADALSALEHLDPDIAFVDVDLADGSGPQLVERFGHAGVGALIVASADESNALRAFDAHAVDFLLKPVEQERLHAAIERARIWIRGRDAPPRPPMRGFAEPQPDQKLLTRLALRTDDRVIFVRPLEVDFFEGSGNYVNVHVGDRVYRLRTTLRELAERLEPKRFRRIHRSSVVNIDRIKEVQSWFGGDYVVILQDGRQLRASRTYAPDLIRPLQ